MSPKYSIGFDFGTESVRCLIVDVSSGIIAAQAADPYLHGVIDQRLPGQSRRLPADYAFQDPDDWLRSAAKITREAMTLGKVAADQIIGIGVDFTSCTMLPTSKDGTPLCKIPALASRPFAWPKLWKHHGAKFQTDRINQIAAERNEPWLARYGGTIGLEWFFPKILETLHGDPEIYHAADVWLEAGDWFVWQLTGGPFPRCEPQSLVRSTCQAGYKACWNAESGYPSPEFFHALDPRMTNVVSEKMPGELRSPGQRAGELTPAARRNCSGCVRALPSQQPLSTRTPGFRARESRRPTPWCSSWVPVPATC